MKRKHSEAKKEELFATCIKSQHEPPPNLESVPKVSFFAMYVDEKNRTTWTKESEHWLRNA